MEVGKGEKLSRATFHQFRDLPRFTLNWEMMAKSVLRKKVSMTYRGDIFHLHVCDQRHTQELAIDKEVKFHILVVSWNKAEFTLR